MLICLDFLSDNFVIESVLFFIEGMSSLIPLLNKPVHITRWEWKGICYLLYNITQFFEFFRVICQKSHSDLSPKFFFH